LGLDTKESVVLLGGTNNGQLSETLLKWCPSITFYGFEIQELHFQTASQVLKPFANAHVLNMGWDESALENVAIGGAGETGGLFDPKGQRGWGVQEKTVNTIALSDFAMQHNIQRTLYVVIDTEGHEPKVIRGMRLNLVENQQRFPLFQYELGGTWAARDSRHGNDPWSLKEAARVLESFGYLLLMCGAENWLAVNPDFFDETENPGMEDEGYGTFIQGNLLAVHSKFAPPPLVARILEQSHIET